MIIKKIFDETFLSMSYYGGISSYSLVLMVSAYLKRFDEEKEESLINSYLYIYKTLHYGEKVIDFFTKSAL